MKLKTFPRGGIVNQTLPDLSAYQSHMTDGFESWLGTEIGWHRMFFDSPTETRADNIRALDEIIRRLDAVIEIDDEMLPPSAEGLITEAAYRLWRNDGVSKWANFTTLGEHAKRAKIVCEVVREQFEELPARTGRQAGTKTGQLLAAVVDRLEGPTLTKRVEMAFEILNLCDVKGLNTFDTDSRMRFYQRSKE